MPSVLLVDDNMPALGGTQLVSFVRQRCRHRCSVLLYSGASSYQDLADKARICGADGYALKTPDHHHLLAEVRMRVDGLVESSCDELLAPSCRVKQLFTLERRTGRDGFVEGFVKRFLSVLDARVQALLTAEAAGDAEAVREQAHFLKGNALNLGADRLSTLCERLQREARKAGSPELRALVRRLPGEADHFRQWITTELARESARPPGSIRPSATPLGGTSDPLVPPTPRTGWTAAPSPRGDD